MGPCCEQCDGTEYEEIDGHYFCIDCNRQSQVLGTVKGVEDLTNQIVTTQKIKKGRERTTSASSGISLSGIPAKPWSIAEGYTQILNVWCSKLEKLGVDRIREPVLDVWSVYLNTIKAAFTTPNEFFDEAGTDQRSVSCMHYRDKWNYLNGPNQVTERSRLLGYKTKKKQEDERKLRRDADKEEKAGTDQERKIQRKYSKAVSETLRTDESDCAEEDIASIKSEAESVVSEKIDLELESDISEVINTIHKSKIKTPADFTLRNVRAVFVLAATCLPGTSVTSSDLAHLFSSDYLPWATCIKYLPKNYKPTIHDKLLFSGQKRGLQLITESLLRKESAELATFIQITDPLKLTLCTTVTFECVLRRYVEDLCLPESIFHDISRTFSCCEVMTLSAEASSPGKLEPKDIPVVAVRVLGLILITLKYHFGLNDMQEYELSKIVTKKNNSSCNVEQNMDQDENVQEQDSVKHFDFLTWLRLSKFRLDYLISNNFTLREQFRRFRHIGVPVSTLESMDEPRLIYQNRTESRTHRGDLYYKLGEQLDNLGESQFQSRVSQVQSFKFLEESTHTWLEEQEDEKVKADLVKLLDMKAESIQLYNNIYKDYEGGQDSNLVQIKSEIPKKYHDSILRCPTIPSSGIPQVYMSDDQEKVDNEEEDNRSSDCSSPVDGVIKKYWFSPFTARNENKDIFFFKRSACDSDFWNYIQFLPENYLWLLNYFSCYALVPLHLLENEVEYLEDYIYKLDKNFFGKNTSEPTQHSSSTSCSQDLYCGCQDCKQVDELYPKESKRMT